MVSKKLQNFLQLCERCCLDYLDLFQEGVKLFELRLNQLEFQLDHFNFLVFFIGVLHCVLYTV